MDFFRRVSAAIFVAFLSLFREFFVAVRGGFNYKDALTRSIIFLEAQRLGKLPVNHRPLWREHSGLDDGKLANVDLTGGYYDAGDNLKYGLPMALTVTTMSWATLMYHSELEAAEELENVHSSILWGTDYFLKASSRRNRFFVQVGDPVENHNCWVRPETMQTPSTVLKIDENTPGTEIAAETSCFDTLIVPILAKQRGERRMKRRGKRDRNGGKIEEGKQLKGE